MSRARKEDLKSTRYSSAQVESVIEARRRNIDGVGVRRLLPSRIRRTVGPFIFMDHMGPHSLGPGEGVDVPPHPHINLATVTYLFEGELVHRDSLGCVQTIRPGDINWMHAGSGIVHSERTGTGLRKTEFQIEGVQLWVALPKAREETTPEFCHYPKAALPSWSEAGLTARILAGSAFGCRSPVKTSSNTLYVDATLQPGARLPIPDARERCIYVVHGSVSSNGQQFQESQMVVLRANTEPIFTAISFSRLLILGGDALDGKRHIWWNFVSSSEERIDRAKRNWKEGRFPVVPGDELERTPLPG